MSRSMRRSSAPSRFRAPTPIGSVIDDSAFDALTARAIAKAESGSQDEAIVLFERCITLRHDENSLCNLAMALKAGNRIAEACATYRDAVGLSPSSFRAHLGLAECLHRQGAYGEARTACEKALAIGPVDRDARRPNVGAAGAFILLGKIYYDLLDFAAAAAAFKTATTHDPENASAFGNLGLSLQELGLLQDAFNALHQAITLKPDYIVGYNNLAGLLIAMGQVEMALACSKIALALAPDNGGLYLNYGLALRLKKDLGGAIEALRTTLTHDPARSEVLLELAHLRQQVCDWAGLATEQSHALNEAIASHKRVPPFVVMTAPSSRRQQLASAQAWMQGLSTNGALPLPAIHRTAAGATRRIRIGYLSADFHSHATAALIAELFEAHDRTRFETFGYSIGPDDGSTLRTRMARSLDHFTDLKDVTSFEVAAKTIHADAIDILVDLKGFTQNARSEILAFRPAPIQVNYLGYPGTMGSDLVDYIIGDVEVTPIEHAADYGECIVQLPECYQPNDRRRAVAPSSSTREECGLPQHGFVFCSFNNTYKITPEVFDIWMRLLHIAPSSVLWLLASNDLVAANLRREAATRGIAEERLVFAPFVASDRHIARMALADLFLDTVPVNAHTTASEALWVGLPVLTCRGTTFAGRVAGSLLKAIGLPDLVTDDLESYETTAIGLLREPDRLRALRNRLATNRLTTPLFDTGRYIAHFEAALTHMVKRHDMGLPPHAFEVQAENGEAFPLGGIV